MQLSGDTVSRAYAREFDTNCSLWNGVPFRDKSKGLGAKFKFPFGANSMKRTLMKLTLVLLALAALAAVGPAEQQSRTVLGKIDHQALLEAVPGAYRRPPPKQANGPTVQTSRRERSLKHSTLSMLRARSRWQMRGR